VHAISYAFPFVFDASFGLGEEKLTRPQLIALAE